LDRQEEEEDVTDESQLSKGAKEGASLRPPGMGMGMGKGGGGGTASARRLIVEGDKVYEPEDLNSPILLRGFSFVFKDYKPRPEDNEILPEDRVVKDLLPGTNLARLVMVRWLDGVDEVEPTTGPYHDCYDENADNGYLTERCLEAFDRILDWSAGDAGMWSVLTARVTFVNGDPAGGTKPTLYDNDELKEKFVAMWGFLARRYKDRDNIAGYEIASEPRASVDASVVHELHEAACGAVWAEDPDAVCFIGPTPFYSRKSYSAAETHDHYLLEGKVIYAANFFEPGKWVESDEGFEWGGTYRCQDVLDFQKSECESRDEMVTLNKDWIERELTAVLEFGSRHNVPMWVDQWGMKGLAQGHDVHAQNQYMADILDVFDKHHLHWSYWLWRRNSNYGGLDGYQVQGQFDDGHFELRQDLVNSFAHYIG